MLTLILLAGCAAPKAQFTDEEWISHSATGRGCFERGDFRRGAEAYARAGQRAQAMDDADALAVAVVNRAVCLLAEGKPEAARTDIGEALADKRVSRIRRAELQVAGARAEVALGKPDEAIHLAGEALELNPSPALRAQALLAKSAAELGKGEVALAVQTLSSGVSTKHWARLPAAIRAEYAVRRAEIAAVESRTSAALSLQDEATELWRQAGRLQEMARSLVAAGQLAQASGDLAVACDRFYRASRSLWAQHLQPQAVSALEQAVACAEESKDTAMGKRLADLVVTFKEK